MLGFAELFQTSKFIGLLENAQSNVRRDDAIVIVTINDVVASVLLRYAF
jgi:hypothetical protein